MTNQNNELDRILDKFHKSKPADTPTYNLYHEQAKAKIQALYAPKPVENGELLTINNLITKWAQIVGVKDGFSYVVKILIDPADGFADDAFSSNLRNELQALLAQEKAKWVSQMLSKCNEKEIVLMGTECKYCGDYVDYCNCHKIRQNQRDEIRQALAKLLDKENTK